MQLFFHIVQKAQLRLNSNHFPQILWVKLVKAPVIFDRVKTLE